MCGSDGKNMDMTSIGSEEVVHQEGGSMAWWDTDKSNFGVLGVSLYYFSVWYSKHFCNLTH